MGSTFTCPNCGRRGSVKKEISPHAKLRCPGCHSLFAPMMSKSVASNAEMTEDDVQAFLGSYEADPVPGMAHEPGDSSQSITKGAPSPDLPVQECLPTAVHHSSSVSRLLGTEPSREGLSEKLKKLKPAATISRRALAISAGALGCLAITLCIALLWKGDPSARFQRFARQVSQRIPSLNSRFKGITDNQRVKGEQEDWSLLFGDVSLDVSKTDSLISHYLGVIILPTITHVHSAHYEVSRSSSIDARYAFQDGKWVCKSITWKHGGIEFDNNNYPDNFLEVCHGFISNIETDLTNWTRVRSMSEQTPTTSPKDKGYLLGMCKEVGPEQYMLIVEFIEVLKSSPDF